MDVKIVCVMFVYDVDQQMFFNGDLIVGVVNIGQWLVDLFNEQNCVFVVVYVKEYGYQFLMFVFQVYDVVMLIDSVVKVIGGKVENCEVFIVVIKVVNFKLVCGGFKFVVNYFLIQNQYVWVVIKGVDGKYVNNMIQMLLFDYVDVYVG